MFIDQRFPIDISLGSTGGPGRATQIIRLASGQERRNSTRADSMRRYNAGYGVKTLAQAQKAIDFFEMTRARLHSFRWRDHSDWRSTPDGSPVTPIDQPLLRLDETHYQLAKTYNYGGSPMPYVRLITKPIAASVIINVDGVDQASPADYALDALTGIITLTAPLGQAAAVRAGYEFDVPVRFDLDQLDLSIISIDAGALVNIPIVEVIE